MLNVAIIFNKILGLKQCPQNTLNNVLLNFIKHMKNWGSTIRYSPQSKNWGGRVPPPSPQDRRPWPWRPYFIGNMVWGHFKRGAFPGRPTCVGVDHGVSMSGKPVISCGKCFGQQDHWSQKIFGVARKYFKFEKQKGVVGQI